MAAQYELLKELLNSGTKLNFEQEFFFKFYQAFILNDRWTQYIKGVSTTPAGHCHCAGTGHRAGQRGSSGACSTRPAAPRPQEPGVGLLQHHLRNLHHHHPRHAYDGAAAHHEHGHLANSRNFTMVGALALGINSGAYVSEIIRGGLMAVDPGQMEAGRSLGLNYMTTMVVIIIPQAIRAVLPALGNEFIVLLKDTSLITVIGGKELLYAAQGIMNRTYEAMFPLLGVALIYLVLVMLFTRLLAKFERRLAQSDR